MNTPSKILLVFGALRSGTTLFRVMLNAHPGLSCTTEHDFLFDYLRGTGDDRAYDREALSRDRIFRGSGLVMPQDRDGLDALHAMIRQIGAMGGGLPVLMLHRNLGRVLDCLPQTPIVHFLRDPRDVARSSIGMMWAGNVYHGIDHWLGTEREWDSAAHQPGARVLTVRYEDLVRDAPAVLARVCHEAGVPYDDAMLGYPSTTTYSAPDASLANQWRRKLSPRDIRLVEAKVGPMLAARGYVPSGLPPLAPSPALRARLRAQNKMHIWARMTRVFGLVPMGERSLGRRFGLRHLEYRGQAKIDAIAATRLK